jgi:hypothetical protein
VQVQRDGGPRCAYPNVKDSDVYSTTVLRRRRVAARVAELAAQVNARLLDEIEVTEAGSQDAGSGQQEDPLPRLAQRA